MPQWEAPGGDGGGTSTDGSSDDSTDTTSTTTGSSPTPVHPEPGVDEPEEDEETAPPSSGTDTGSEETDPQPEESEPVDDATTRDDEIGEQARDLRQRAIHETGVDPTEHDDITAGDLVRVEQRGDRLVTEATDRGRRFFSRQHVMDEEGFAPDEFELQEVDDGFIVETTDVFDERLREETGGEHADVVDPAAREEGFDTAQFFDSGPGADVVGPDGTLDRPTIDVAPRPVEQEQAELPDETAATAESPGEREGGWEDGPLTEEVAEQRFEHFFGHDDFDVEETDDGFQAVVEAESEPTREEQFIDSATDAGRQAFGIATIPASAAFDQLPDGIEREAFALATMPPRLVGDQVIDGEDDRAAVRDATMAAAAAGVVSPEPVTTVGGAAILGGAALAAGTAQRTEIEIDPMQEFGHDEVEVPEEQQQAEISTPADPTVHDAEVQPGERFATEVDVPAEEQTVTDPRTIQAQQMVVGSELRHQQESEFDEEEVDGTIIIPADLFEESQTFISELAREQQERVESDVERDFGTEEVVEDIDTTDDFERRDIEDIGTGVSGLGEPETAEGEETFFDRFQRVAEDEIERQERAEQRFWEVSEEELTPTQEDTSLADEAVPAEQVEQTEVVEQSQRAGPSAIEILPVAEALDTPQVEEQDDVFETDLLDEVAAETELTAEEIAREQAREQAVEQVEQFVEPNEIAMEMAEPTLTEEVFEFGHPELTETVTEQTPGDPSPPRPPEIPLDFDDDSDSRGRRGRGIDAERVEFDVLDAAELDAEVASEIASLEDELDDALGGT